MATGPTGSSSVTPDIARVTAPILFGPLVNWALYGVLCVQIYVYSYNFPNDKPAMKTLAYFAFLLETVQTALTGADVYYWFIDGFGDVERLKDSHFAPIDIPIFHAIISLVVQEYFCYRIWTLNKRSSWLCIIIAIVSVVQSIGAAWGGIKSAMIGKFAVSKVALYLWSLPSALADVLIAAAMLSLLLRRTDGNRGRFTNFVLVRLVRLTIETNALTACVAIASFVLYVAFPNEIYYTFTAGIIGKLYSNTLLVSLNNRIYFRDHPCPGLHVDGHRLVGFDNTRPSAIASLHFAQARQPANTTAGSDSFKLDEVSHKIDFEKGTNGVVSV